MIKKLILIIIFLFGIQFTNAQEKSKIDSINNIIVQKASISSDSLIKLFQKNISDSESINYPIGKADALAKLSIVYYYQGKYNENVSSQLEAIRVYEVLNDLSKVAINYGELGYQMKRRDLSLAQYYMQKGKDIAESLNDEDVLKNLYNNYGVLKELNNELDSALYFYNKGLVIKEKQGDSFGIPYSVSNIAGIYYLKKDYKKAKKQFKESLNKRIALNDSIGISENLRHIAEIYLDEGSYYEAIEKLKESNLIAINKDYYYLIKVNNKSISEAYKNLKNADSALYYFEEYNIIKDSILNINVEEKIATLTIEFETEKKEKEILQQKALLIEKEIQVKKKNYIIFGSLGFALVLCLIGYLLYNQQRLKNRQLEKENELKRALIKIETQNKLQEQRLRISRDLHDNIGSQLTFIISSLDNLKYGFKDMSDALSSKLSGISTFTTQTIYELRDTIWAMNKNTISFEDLETRITNFIDNAKIAFSSIDYSFVIEPSVNQSHTFTSVQGMNLYRIIQEAINNSIKYANASKVKVNISENKDFQIEICDNGIGYDQEKITLGNGILNMEKRAKELNGKIKTKAVEGEGTKITINIPL